jgi:NAD(P)-dependent dehydrogenase (short-subunit alcohol dehydrogenase family)
MLASSLRPSRPPAWKPAQLKAEALLSGSLSRQEGGRDIHFVQLDLADLSSVRAAAEELKAAEPNGFHGLLLNAGVMACPLT